MTTLILGVDEAGRGALVGDVVAAAVVLPVAYDLPKLNDSKQLTAAARERLYTAILEQALTYGIASATPQEIDTLNIHHATLLAMQRAVEQASKALWIKQSIEPTEVLVDGKFVPRVSYPARAVVGGDGLVASIAAASILAKVSRDRALSALHQRHPEYGFAQHKGYATTQHLAAIKRFGALAEHRLSFAPLKNQQPSLFD